MLRLVVAGAGVVAAGLIGFGVYHWTTATPAPAVPHVTKTCDVLDYGADTSGSRDSGAAIEAAVQACSAAPGGEVTLPAGTFAIMHGVISVSGPNGPVITGAGPHSTFIVQHARANILSVTADGTTLENLNLDTATYFPGVPADKNNPVPDVLFVRANHVTVSNIIGRAGTGFGLRLIGPLPCDNYTRGDNTVQNVDMTNTGKAGFAAIDISCQHDTRVINVTIHGASLSLFRDIRTTLDGEQYTPGPFDERCAAPWYITGPAHDITISNVTSHGGRGIIHGITTDVQVSSQTLSSSGC